MSKHISMMDNIATAHSNTAGMDQDLGSYGDKLQQRHKSCGEKRAVTNEVREPVLLQWKDREMADDLSKLMTSGSETNVTTNTSGVSKDSNSDVEMRDS